MLPADGTDRAGGPDAVPPGQGRRADAERDGLEGHGSDANPGEVTWIRVRFTAQDGSPFQFDPTVGPGYVWHCHIIDHEDNEMMRPYQVTH